jgi:hypothetical protein
MEAIFPVCGAGGPQLKRNPLGSTGTLLMLRPSTLLVVLCHVTSTALAGQVNYLDSTTTAKANAQCGAVADDSVFVDSLWVPGPRTLVSVHAYGLQVPDLQSAPTVQYPARLERDKIQGRVVVVAIVGVNGRIEPGSVKVVETPHQDFVPVMEHHLYGARFTRPRLRKHPVRVCIVVPAEFHTR